MRCAALAHGEKIATIYMTFNETVEAIEKKGPIIVSNPRADIILFAVSGRFDGSLMAVRQSGLNIRRFLVRPDTFADEYGTMENCIDHPLSNNAVECELEVTHLRDLHEARGLGESDLNEPQDVDRLGVDLIAAVQLLGLYEECTGVRPELDIQFSLGFSVGSLFSSAQTTATLEGSALKARRYEESYRERGKQGRSADRKTQPAERLLARMGELNAANPAFHRIRPEVFANLAVEDCAAADPKLWSQGRGQTENYLTLLASDIRYRQRYNALFLKTG